MASLRTETQLGDCPKCGSAFAAGTPECPRCGVIFAKLARPQLRSPRWNRWEVWVILKERALTLPALPSSPRVAAQGAVWLVLLGLGWSLMSSSIEVSQLSPSWPHHLLSNVNLVFHEAGHVLFRPLGRFMTILGGSLLQVLVPALCTAAFLTRYPDNFGASVTLWWTGQSLIDLAPYINDARSQQLILLGGVTGRDRPGYHDWNNLLGQLGWLEQDHTLALLCHTAGVTLLGLALIWGIYLIVGQVNQLRSSA